MNSKYYLITFLILLIGCDKADEPLNAEEILMVGQWELTEAYISAGGPQYWVDVEDGEEIKFFENGIFTSNKFSECSMGSFSINENDLFLKYNCPGFNSTSENEDGFITYKLELFANYFILTPTSGPICTEGCSYKYLKKG